MNTNNVVYGLVIRYIMYFHALGILFGCDLSCADFKSFCIFRPIYYLLLKLFSLSRYDKLNMRFQRNSEKIIPGQKYFQK